MGDDTTGAEARAGVGDMTGARSETARSHLPFGAVMAMGAVSQLAGPAGIGALRVPLLWMTIAMASVVVGAGAISRQPRGRRAPAERFGDFTVPIGLAIVGGGLSQLGGSAATAGAALVVASAWAVTAALMATVMLPVTASLPRLAAVDGAWFLAPAAVLADAVGLAAVAGRARGGGPALGWLAVGAAGIGTIGYLLVVSLAAARLRVHGLAGTPRAPWWIAAGCGGLCAAALGRASTVDPAGGGAVLHAFGWPALACWTVGSVALVPVLAGSVRYLAGVRHVAGWPPWSPTFSTGAYALGAAQVGRLVGSPPITALAGVAAAAAVCLWALTVLAQLSRLGRRLPQRARRPST